MTDEKLEEIRKRFDAVWPFRAQANWTLSIEPEEDLQESPLVGNMRIHGHFIMKYVDMKLVLPDGSIVLAAEHTKHFKVGSAGTTFLMYAPQDVRHLLEEVDRLRQELKEKDLYIFDLENGEEV